VRNSSALKSIAAKGVGALVLAACGAYVWRSFQWQEAFGLLSRADPAWFLAGGGAGIIAFWTIRALRWQFLLRAMRAEGRFVELYLCCAVALSFSVFTPLQSGELLKVELLKRYGRVARLPGYSALLLERAVDLYAIVAIGIVALAFRAGFLSPGGTALAAVLLPALPVASYLLLHRLQPHGRLGQVVGLVQEGVRSPAALGMVLVLTFLGWAMVALAWQACFVSLSIALGIIDMLGLLSAITLASIISFVPGGIGIVEAGVAEILIGHGIDAPLAQAGALLLRALSFVTVGLGLLHWLVLRRRPVNRSA
jgi:uncharacterized membrane protein YbhN (UPF0104 family)